MVMKSKLVTKSVPVKMLLFVLIFMTHTCTASSKLPLVINTWPFTNATEKAWQVLQVEGKDKIDALVAGCQLCQEQQCDGTVGYGGSPDETGETTLDAMIMNGDTLEAGAVGDLRRVKDAIGVARAVMDHTEHTMIVGVAATNFALKMGFSEESLSTSMSVGMWKQWMSDKCQPNFRKSVFPDPKTSCGPYKPVRVKLSTALPSAACSVGHSNHDTIGMVVVDENGNIAAATSTNGLSHKIPGRVGDSPIVGAGAYVVSGVGGATSTGDGDVMMKFLPSFHAVMLLSHGRNVSQAASEAVAPIAKAYPRFSGAVIVADSMGNFGAACHSLGVFHYSVRNPSSGKVVVLDAKCT